jgi:hypothetical protein
MLQQVLRYSQEAQTLVTESSAQVGRLGGTPVETEDVTSRAVSSKGAIKLGL